MELGEFPLRKTFRNVERHRWGPPHTGAGPVTVRRAREMERHSVPQVGEGLRQRAGTADVQMIQNAPNFCPNHKSSWPKLPISIVSFCARREGGARGGCCGGRDGCVCRLVQAWQSGWVRRVSSPASCDQQKCALMCAGLGCRDCRARLVRWSNMSNGIHDRPRPADLFQHFPPFLVHHFHFPLCFYAFCIFSPILDIFGTSL